MCVSVVGYLSLIEFFSGFFQLIINQDQEAPESLSVVECELLLKTLIFI